MHRRALRRAWQQLTAGPPPPRALVEAAAALSPGRALDGPGGVRITASCCGWSLVPRDARLPTTTLPVGGHVELPEHGVVLRCATGGAEPAAAASARGASPLDPPPWALTVAANGPLSVGGREPGGARDARALLQRLPAGIRHLVPLVRDSDGTLLAVGARAVGPPPHTDAPRILVTAHVVADAPR